ncbi:hypothetical protein HMPREF1627_00495 [Actinomyces sp. S6-Spd3]|nr:hypothetical protein HMPREF1627_00495 [Actinomyces sp. S6-Spd3]
MFHEATECALRVHKEEQAGEHYRLMADVAELSARTHRTDFPKQQRVWVWPLWYLANELSSIAAVTKLEACIPLMNPVMSRIGSFGYGSKDALVSLEKEISESLTDFVTRIGEPLDTRVAKRITNVDMDLLVAQTLSQWGGGALPLGNVSRAVIQEIFAEAASQYA